MIPVAALDQGTQAFLKVLRGRFPDASFLVRDGAVRPNDVQVAGKIGTCATAHIDARDESAENVSPLGRGERLPQLDQRTANRKPRRAR